MVRSKIIKSGLGVAAVMLATVASCRAIAADAHDEAAGTVGDLLKSGWQIAGYTSTFDNRSTLILFRNPNETYLVQCLTGYDVQRSPRVYQNCYKLK